MGFGTSLSEKVALTGYLPAHPLLLPAHRWQLNLETVWLKGAGMVALLVSYQEEFSQISAFLLVTIVIFIIQMPCTPLPYCL